MRLLNTKRFDLECVSIHASVKDATVKGSNAPHSSCVSIHASVKDATMRLKLILKVMVFQSTHL